jgi:glycosyltransferase involved in cell wall biosynthesis
VSDRTVAPITVAISTRNRPGFVERCLHSVLDGSTLPAEIVVVDQSDDTRTRAVVERSGAGDDTRLVYAHDNDRGLAQARNFAVARAAHERIAMIDDDCVVDNAWLESVWRTLEGADVAGGRVLPLGPEAEGRYAVASRTSIVRRTLDANALPWDVGSGNNFAFVRAWYDRIGGCDARLGVGSRGKAAEDMDLFYRLLRAGARVCYEPDALVFHERATRSERLSRRVPYGHGMGACCTLWLRDGDRGGLRVLAAWFRLRGALVTRALLRRRWPTVYEELLVLAGTLRGIGYGLRVPGPGPMMNEDKSASN